MHIETDFWNLVFGLVVFALFIYKVVDLIRSKGIPFLASKIQEHNDAQTEILEREELLAATRKKIEKKVLDQKRQFIALENNMQVLQDYALMQQELKRKEQEDLLVLLKQRREQQAMHRRQCQALLAAIPHVFVQAENKLRTMTATSSNDGFLREITAKK